MGVDCSEEIGTRDVRILGANRDADGRAHRRRVGVVAILSLVGSVQRVVTAGAAALACPSLNPTPGAASGESEGMRLGAAGFRLGIMGGTFDPIHYAHLFEASEVAHVLALDEVVFVPAGRPWQKDGRAISPAEDRYAMAAIATRSNRAFSVSRVEVDRPGPTYTVDTLRELRGACGPEADLFFILGADALAQIFTWRDASELFTFAHFVGCSRVGYQLADPGIPIGSVSLVEISGLAISSSLIRRRVRAGQPIRYLVPDGVAQYISQHGLYRDGDG